MNLPPHAYNPSILRHDGKLLLTFRVHDRGDWRTSLYIAELGEGLEILSVAPIRVPPEVSENSIEDGRCFFHNNQLHLSYTNSLFPATVFRSVAAYGRLTQDAEGWKVGCIIPQYGRNDFSALEKNWTFISRKHDLWCLYMTHERQATFIQLDGGKVVSEATGKVLPWGYGERHGGTIVSRPDGRHLHFFSSRTNAGSRERNRYLIGCAELSAEPPFDMLRISRRPIVYGEEGANLDKKNKRFKPSVCFPTGAIQEGKDWLLAYGWNDCECRVLRLTEEELLLQ